MRRESQEKRKKFLVYLLGFVMLASTFSVIFFGFAAGATKNIVKYNGFKLVDRGNFWTTVIDKKEILFSYFPSDVEQIPTENEAIEKLKGAVEIDLTSDFNDTFAQSIALAQFQTSDALSNFNVFVRTGFTNETKTNFQVITCNISTNFVPVVYFKSSNETKIYLKDSCITGEVSANTDAAKIKDRLLYGMFGLIKSNANS
ncbi:hypothetical protein HYX01_03485 [Candidatus Woesearchaeota archaeon]|nr:hypothetical protein [Candidatus Woesearchaeota archaeon]